MQGDGTRNTDSGVKPVGAQTSLQPAAAKPNPVTIWAQALANTSRFYANKLRYAYLALSPAPRETGAVRHARARIGEIRGVLPYCQGRNALGIMCAVQPAWMYLGEFPGEASQKSALIRRLLAKLPGGVTLHFAFHSNLPDAALVRQSFAGCGFQILDWKTYVYTPPSEYTGELLDSFSGKSIKGTLRRARRDLEIIDISARDYIDIQQANLAASGKKNSRNDALDQLMLEEAMRRKCARIFAARRKATAAHPGPHPVEAALVCLWDDASRIIQLWRLTYREHGYGALKPHVDASKLLVLAAMQDAADRQFILDTDGYTSGMAKLYALFGPGVFRLADRLHCERECLLGMLCRYYPSLRRLLAKALAMRA